MSATSADEVQLAEQVAMKDEVRAELIAPRDRRLYTIVGHLRPPGADGNTVPDEDWEFRGQSGKSYIARGVDASRVARTDQGLMVIRAQIVGRTDDGFIILDVKDVFQPEEP